MKYIELMTTCPSAKGATLVNPDAHEVCQVGLEIRHHLVEE